MINDSTNVRVIADNIKKLEKMVKEAGSELPTPGVGDTGKILKVGSDGYELATEYSYTPPAYSTTEYLTGRKWIDGRDVYERVITGTFTEITTSQLYIVSTDFVGDYILTVSSKSYDAGGVAHGDFTYAHNETNGRLGITVNASYSEQDYVVIVDYVKPEPTPGNETKKKTTKKG